MPLLKKYRQMSRRPRIFYFAPLATEALNSRFGTTEFVSPAVNKVFGLAQAVRVAGVSPVIVSGYLPSAVQVAWRVASHIRVEGVTFAKLYATGSGGIKRLTSMISYLRYAAAVVRGGDRVVLYNAFLEYLPAAIYLWANGNAATIDIEDAPRRDENDLRGHLSRLAYRALKPFCSARCLTVSLAVSNAMGYRNGLPLYGVASYLTDDQDVRKRNATPHILYGGAISTGTGKELFLSATRIIAAQEPFLELSLIISGRYDSEEFAQFKVEIEAKSAINVELLGDLTRDAYRRLLKRIDVGLCLKLPSHSLGQTTFPSKVLEYAANGVLVCSTVVSDVPLIFNSEDAILLMDESPEGLAGALVAAARDREMVSARAERGEIMVRERFSAKQVGEDLVRYLYAGI